MADGAGHVVVRSILKSTTWPACATGTSSTRRSANTCCAPPTIWSVYAHLATQQPMTPSKRLHPSPTLAATQVPPKWLRGALNVKCGRRPDPVSGFPQPHKGGPMPQTQEQKLASVRSSATKVQAKCPMCGNLWMWEHFYTGRLPARKFCSICQQAVPYRTEHDPYHPRTALAMVR